MEGVRPESRIEQAGGIEVENSHNPSAIVPLHQDRNYVHNEIQSRRGRGIAPIPHPCLPYRHRQHHEEEEPVSELHNDRPDEPLLGGALAPDRSVIAAKEATDDRVRVVAADEHVAHVPDTQPLIDACLPHAPAPK